MAAWRIAESLKKLRAQIDAAYPKRSKASDGAIGDLLFCFFLIVGKPISQPHARPALAGIIRLAVFCFYFRNQILATVRMPLWAKFAIARIVTFTFSSLLNRTALPASEPLSAIGKVAVRYFFNLIKIMSIFANYSDSLAIVKSKSRESLFGFWWLRRWWRDNRQSLWGGFNYKCRFHISTAAVLLNANRLKVFRSDTVASTTKMINLVPFGYDADLILIGKAMCGRLRPATIGLNGKCPVPIRTGSANPKPAT